MDEAKLIQRAKAALYRYRDNPFDVEEASVEELDGRHYVRLAGQGDVIVYRVHKIEGGDTIRIMRRPPAKILNRGN